MRKVRKKGVIRFWSGNRSASRRAFEREVLRAVIECIPYESGYWEIEEDPSDVPGETEAQVFVDKTHDLLVTVGGNPKFDTKDTIVIPQPLDFGMLGSRLLIIRKEDAADFGAIRDKAGLQHKVQGIPLSWADATIFRANGFAVKEEGRVDDLLQRLAGRQFDYTTFGALEVLQLFEPEQPGLSALMIEDTLLLQYEMPLLFYVRSDRPHIAALIEKGLKVISNSGLLRDVLQKHFGGMAAKLQLGQRKKIELRNPLFP
ncbi:hypothetical protein CYPRO_1482 [Cyclonatronum proteinivorum]|uniref:ABC-type amino acid transport substrate-binding protein n=1 Tax=Cyclonatronum proteinivorum TaxID=1457365 RepID=A0A345UJT6_9BACT|nr:hypothetical protein [Cyclonatronum proteinivorum]AXJ00738.1 hypothetical protein CYPRO_1482 [Cyclonatronum proteinivorum]